MRTNGYNRQRVSTAPPCIVGSVLLYYLPTLSFPKSSFAIRIRMPNESNRSEAAGARLSSYGVGFPARPLACYFLPAPSFDNLRCDGVHQSEFDTPGKPNEGGIRHPVARPFLRPRDPHSERISSNAGIYTLESRDSWTG